MMQGRQNAIDRAQRDIVVNMPKEPQLGDSEMEKRARISYSDPKSPFYKGEPEQPKNPAQESQNLDDLVQ